MLYHKEFARYFGQSDEHRNDYTQELMALTEFKYSFDVLAWLVLHTGMSLDSARKMMRTVMFFEGSKWWQWFDLALKTGKLVGKANRFNAWVLGNK
jgi:hypothetical protein